MQEEEKRKLKSFRDSTGSVDENLIYRENIALKEETKRLKEEKEVLDCLIESMREEFNYKINELEHLNLQLKNQFNDIEKENKKSARKTEVFMKMVTEETKLEYNKIKKEYDRLQQENNKIKEELSEIKIQQQSYWKIKYEEINIKEEIGKGEFGIVLKAIWRYSMVAVKHLYHQNFNTIQLQEFIQEANIAKNLRPHANVVQFLGICTEPKLLIITEYLPYGSVHSLLHSKVTLNITTTIKLAMRAAAGMHHLHSENIIHRDLAARNLLLVRNNKHELDCKVSDFGLR